MSKKDKKQTPKVHKDLDGLELEVDAFGEIKSNVNIDKINLFLNRNVDDKKLKDRSDIQELKEGKENDKKDQIEDPSED